MAGGLELDELSKGHFELEPFYDSLGTQPDMPGTTASTSNVYSLHLYPGEHRAMISYHAGKNGTMLKRKRKEKPCRGTHGKEWQSPPLDELPIAAASDDCSSYKVDFHPALPTGADQVVTLHQPRNSQGLSEMCLCMSTEGWGEEFLTLF